MCLLEMFIVIVEKIEYYCFGLNCGDRVSNIFFVDIWCGIVDRFEERWESVFWIQVGGWGNVNGVDVGWVKIGKDIVK